MIAQLIVPKEDGQNPEIAAEELRGQYPWLHSIRILEMVGSVIVQFDGPLPLDLREIVEDCLGWMFVEDTWTSYPAPPKNV